MPLSNSKSLAALIVLLFAATLSPAAETDVVSGASPYGMPPGDWSGFADGEAGQAMARWRDELNLSTEQLAIMAEIIADYGNRLRPLFADGAATAWSIMNVAPRDPDYTVDTERAAQAAAETAAAIVRQMSELRSAINSIMTTEQIATLERLMEESRLALEAKHAARNAPPANED